MCYISLNNHTDTSASPPLVNRWTEFDPLEEIVVGRADGGCFPPHEPACQAEFQDQYTPQGPTMSHPFSEYIPWPTGPKLQRTIDAANEQMDGLQEVLEGEGVIVRRPDAARCNFNVFTKTPDFKCVNQYGAGCPRDLMITVGNEILEAPMSKRSRFFEYRPYRKLCRYYFDNDPKMVWSCAPKPLMEDASYNAGFWELTDEQRIAQRYEYKYCCNENEIFFDAADILVIGDVIFVQHSMTTNLTAIRWLKRHFEPKGFTVRTLHFPYDLYPAHIDATFVCLRPGLMLTNPDRPVVREEAQIFKQNDWRMVDVPMWSATEEHPILCQSTRWLSMNVLSVTSDKIIIEDGEEATKRFFEEDLGYDVIGVPYRKVFEFGGSLHCSTWDVRRRGSKRSFFSETLGCEEDIGMTSLTSLP